MVKGPGVVTGRYGTLGQVFYINEDFWPLNTTLYVCNFKSNDPRFVSYFLRGLDFLAYSDKAAVPGLNRNHLHQAAVRVPSDVGEQRAIAHILGTLDDKIELNRRMNETLEAMARALFKSWFVDFDPVRAKAAGRDPSLPQTLADLFPDRFEDSELGEIPKGWRVASLEQMFHDDEGCVLTGPFGSNLHAHDYREEGVPLILVKHVIDGQILEDGLPCVGDHKLPDLERYRLQLGDIVFTRVGAVGRSGYVHARCVGWLISGQMLRVRVPDWSVLHPRYLAQLFLEKTFTDMVEGHALGTTRPSLNTGLLRAFRFIAPPGELGQLFTKKMTVFDALIQTNRDASHTLAALRDTLLPKLISGALRVKDAERFIGRVV
jgi:type I restriction enzyme S subunit